jgi:hypothetical protein
VARPRTGLRIAAAVCTLAAAVLILVGPLTRWADVSADPQAFAASMRESVAVVRPIYQEVIADFTWLEADRHGDVAMLAGIAVLALAVVVAIRATVAGAVATIALGALCVVLAIAFAPDARALRADAEDVVAQWAFAAQVSPGDVGAVLDITRGPSVSTVLAGGVLTVLGGLLTFLAVPPEASPSWVGWGSLESDDEGGTPPEV